VNTITTEQTINEIHKKKNNYIYRRFRPHLSLGYQQRLQAILSDISCTEQINLNELLTQEISTIDEKKEDFQSLGLKSSDLIPTIYYSSTLRVLRDLVLQGWTVREDDEGIILDAPSIGMEVSTNPEYAKKELRKSFSFVREAQFRDPSTKRFIKSMERRGISSLFENGTELVNRLGRLGVEGINPDIELIEAGIRDPISGLLLQDIWRYARYYWSIPYSSTPGRNMFYLIRDTANDMRPLIGIAALGNPVLGLAQRDDYFGWTLNGLKRHLLHVSPYKRQALLKHLYVVLEEGINETYSADLEISIFEGEWRDKLKHLEFIKEKSATERLKQLENTVNSHSPDYQLIRDAHNSVAKGDHELVDWEKIARTALYRRKRAATLYELIWAINTLNELGFPESNRSFDKTIGCDDGVRALEIALRRVKQQVIASSVMELITCGSVPPYRDLLGGKLVATLMLSRKIVNHFKNKYSSRVSLIASALAGRPVSRPTRLAVLTTSSLYSIGSSQYNRIKVPVGGGALLYKRIGKTESYGTVHFSSDTIEHLNEVVRLSESKRNINNIFGEGTSPKLRLVRSGLDALGLSSETFLRHNSPRLIYAASLCSNTEDILLGLSNVPDYLLSNGDSNKFLVEYWKQRWLQNRLHRQDILDRVKSQNFEIFRLSSEIDTSSQVLQNQDDVYVKHKSLTEDNGETSTQNDDTFIERLYRSTNSYADRLSQDEISDIHIDLSVDKYLLEKAKPGKEIVVTGNPGDGKTHLIERLRKKLEDLNAVVITDANACSDEDILSTWKECRKKKRPFVLAINEWPLFVLRRQAEKEKFTGVSEALRQVTSSCYFLKIQQPEPPKDNVVVIDLSLRNLLTPIIINKVIDRLTQKRFYNNLNSSDPALTNREALCHRQVRSRISELLNLVASRIGHVTMRQLIGFIAFLITGGQSAVERLKAGQDATSFTYANLAFTGGEGRLFDAIREVFDPASITNPKWDEKLWIGNTSTEEWLWDMPPAPLTLPESEREEQYKIIKRRFFFEHSKGDQLISLLSNDEREFHSILISDEKDYSKLVRDLILAINRFYEPDCPGGERDRLYLWQSHRYDVRAPSVFVVIHDIPYHQLRIERLKFATWVKAWLPEKQQYRRSFALVASENGNDDIALIEIDRELYLTLFEAQRGLGKASWSRTATRRITKFIDNINRSIDIHPGVEDVRIRNVDNDLDERFSIQRSPARFQL